MDASDVALAGAQHHRCSARPAGAIWGRPWSPPVRSVAAAVVLLALLAATSCVSRARRACSVRLPMPRVTDSRQPSFITGRTLGKVQLMIDSWKAN